LIYLTFRCAAAFFFIICSLLSADISVDDDDVAELVADALAELDDPTPGRLVSGIVILNLITSYGEKSVWYKDALPLL